MFKLYCFAKITPPDTCFIFKNVYLRWHSECWPSCRHRHQNLLLKSQSRNLNTFHRALNLWLKNCRKNSCKYIILIIHFHGVSDHLVKNSSYQSQKIYLGSLGDMLKLYTTECLTWKKFWFLTLTIKVTLTSETVDIDKTSCSNCISFFPETTI